MSLENKVKIEMKKIEKTVIIPDMHCPYEDYRALDAIYSFIKDYKPDRVVQIGDMVDFYALSRFSKDPDRLTSLQEEIDVARYHLGKIREVHKGELIVLEGNHEARLQKYLMNNPEFSSIRAVNKVEKLLGMDDFNVKYRENYMIHGYLLKHGHLVRNKSGYTARGELESEGTSGGSGHCFSEDTEILTQRGWIKGFDLLASDKVMTMNKKTFRGEWNSINEFHEYNDYDELFRITASTIDLLVTDKHGLIFEDEKGRLREIQAREMINQKGTMRFFNSTLGSRWQMFIDKLSDRQKLLINIVTDGSYDNGAIRWHLSKDRKIVYLRGLLDRLGLTYSESKQKNGNTKFRLNVEDSQEFIDIIGEEKKLGNWVLSLSAMGVLKEYSITDGCKNSSATNSYQISSSKEEEIDLLQQLFTTNNMRATKNKHGNVWTLTVNTRNGIVLTKNNVSVEEYSGRVWCVNVNNGTLLVRRNGKVTVTLNTHRIGKVYRTNRSGAHSWDEFGHVCDVDKAEYMKGRVADWQEGFGIHEYSPSRKIWRTVGIPIINNSFMHGDKIYSWRKDSSHPERVALG